MRGRVASGGGDPVVVRLAVDEVAGLPDDDLVDDDMNLAVDDLAVREHERRDLAEHPAALVSAVTHPLDEIGRGARGSFVERTIRSVDLGVSGGPLRDDGSVELGQEMLAAGQHLQQRCLPREQVEAELIGSRPNDVVVVLEAGPDGIT